MAVQYTPEAQARVQAYLDSVAARLRASSTLDAGEVLQGLEEHIDRELADRQQPVTPGDVEEVLARLGPPDEVVGDQDLSWWRKMILALRTGPEDWRLAYLSLATLIVGTPLTGGFGLFGSFFLSRAAMSLAGEPDPPAKKWLIYPSLVLVYSLLAFVGLLWPVALVAAIQLVAAPPQAHSKLLVVLAPCVALTIWWSFLWLMRRRHPAAVKTLFRPFAENWTGRAFSTLVITVWLISAALAAAIVALDTA